jgi:hypothetical protein
MGMNEVLGERLGLEATAVPGHINSLLSTTFASLKTEHQYLVKILTSPPAFQRTWDDRMNPCQFASGTAWGVDGRGHLISRKATKQYY